MSDGLTFYSDNTSPRSHNTNSETTSTDGYNNMITPSVSESPTNPIHFGEINYTELQSTVSTISSASVNDYLESGKSEIPLKEHSSLDVIITLPQSAPVPRELLLKRTYRRRISHRDQLQCTLCAVQRRESNRQVGLAHYRALWPLGVCPHTFETIHSGDSWAAIVHSNKESNKECIKNNDVYCPTARKCLSSNRIALLQQLFPFDIKPFCSY
jgi:hypothetical protein